MERDELERRYKQAEFNSMAYMCEHGLIKPEQNSTEPEEQPAPTLAQIMGVKPHRDVGPGMTEDDRLRRWAGLK